MTIEKNDCAIDETDWRSSRCSSESGPPIGGHRRRTVWPKKKKKKKKKAEGATSADGRAGRQQQKSAASTSGRRLSDMLDKYQCDLDCPPGSAGASNGAELGRGSSAEKHELASQPGHPLGDALRKENSAAAAAAAAAGAARRESNGSVEWPDEAARKAAEERMRRKPAAKHIHPCVCDLSQKQRVNIEQYLRERRAAQQKFERRVQEIEEEIRLAEEAEQQRLSELEAEKEFYGDEYELEGVRRKRKKRSARRASMVSLGVKQIISWRKPPKIQVRFTRTSNLRLIATSYCKPRPPSLPEVRPVDVNYFEQPEIPIRANRTVELRLKFIKNHIATSKERQVKVKYPNRPPFVTHYW